MLEQFSKDWGGFFIAENATVKLEAFLKVILCFNEDNFHLGSSECGGQPNIQIRKPQ